LPLRDVHQAPFPAQRIGGEKCYTTCRGIKNPLDCITMSPRIPATTSSMRSRRPERSLTAFALGVRGAAPLPALPRPNRTVAGARFLLRAADEKRNRGHDRRSPEVKKLRIPCCTPVFSDFRTFDTLQVTHEKSDPSRERTKSSPRKYTGRGWSDPTPLPPNSSRSLQPNLYSRYEAREIEHRLHLPPRAHKEALSE